MAQNEFPNTWIKPVMKGDKLELHFPGDISFDSMEDVDIIRKHLNEHNMDIVAYSNEKFEYLETEKE